MKTIHDFLDPSDIPPSSRICAVLGCHAPAAGTERGIFFCEDHLPEGAEMIPLSERRKD